MKPHPILYPLSLVYGCGVWTRNLLFDNGILKSVDVGVPVISIGNITAGGTGKTPMTIEVAKYFLGRGKRVAVVSRGYGRMSRGTIVVSDGMNLLANVAQGGDEMLFIARQLPNAIVIADEKRVRGAKKAVEEYRADIIVLDDGFQHRYLQRRVDVVLLDGTWSLMKSMLLPAGYRREPLNSLRRADAVVVTKVRDPLDASPIMSDPNVATVTNKFSSSYVPVAVINVFGGVRQPLDILKGHSVIAMSGIANPKSFESNIESLGAAISSRFAFADHHRYTNEEIRQVLETHRLQRTDFIITTEKDAVKLSEFKNEFSEIPVFALMMEVQIHQQEQWKQFLSSAV
ncbi:MAG: tetraacyldisaccharide 4'-kinase [Bacteroidota bacterium]